MATHDYNLANQDGASFRSDLNNALAAIVSNNSSSTSPATTFAHQIWVDTTANVIKQRNAANDAWIELWRIDGGFNAKTFSSNVTLNAQSDLRFADSDSSNWVAFQAPATVSSNVTWTLPSADGTSGQALTTNGSGTLSWSSASADTITEGNTSAEVVDTGSDGHFKVVTEGTEALRINSSQRVGIGTTVPEALAHISGTSGGSRLDCLRLTNNSTDAGTETAIIFENTTGTFEHAAIVGTRDGGASLNFEVSEAERARIDNDGRLIVGATSEGENSLLSITGSTSGSGDTASIFLRNGLADGSVLGSYALGRLRFGNAGGECARIDTQSEDSFTASSRPGRLMFYTTPSGSTTPAERMRITEKGFTKIFKTSVHGPTSNYHEIGNKNDVSGDINLALLLGGTNTVNTSSKFLICGDNIADRLYIYGNGNVVNTNNSYGTLSDVKLKENIEPAASQWNDLKSIEIVNYNLIGIADRQLGVVAQQVETISPGLVDETPDVDTDGNDLGTVTKSVKSSVLYMKAVKALQEAMERIETLETANASLEARLTALENA